MSENMNEDTEPDILSVTEDLSLFGGCINNIEFVVEEGDDEVNADDIHEKIEVPDVEPENMEILSSIDSDDEIKEECVTEMEVSQTDDFWDNAGSEILEESEDSQDVKPSTPAGFQEDFICYVPRCRKEPLKNNKVHWFFAPLEENLRKIWDICIDRSDKRLEAGDPVCSRHFLKEDIIYPTDGKAKESGKPQLRPGAVPCIKFQEECCVPTCKSKTGKMFCFPVAYKSNFHLWYYMVKNPILKNLRIKELLTYRVCERHFERDCFKNGTISIRTAAPTLFLPESNFPAIVSIQPLSNEDASNVVQSYLYLKCIHGKCRNRSNCNKSVFMFPTDPDRCIEWLKACGKERMIKSPSETVKEMRNKSYGVCEDHFDFDSFGSTMDKLKPWAVPKAHKMASTEGSKEVSSQQIKSPSISATRMTRNSSVNQTPITASRNLRYTAICCYKGCTKKVSGNVTFFSFPTNEARYNAWLDACGYSNLTPQEKQYIANHEKICSDHFSREMFHSDSKLKKVAMPIDYIDTLSSDNTGSGYENGPRTYLSVPKKRTRLHCAVKNCGNFYSSGSGRGKYYMFPDPEIDEDRYNMWLKLLGNQDLMKKSYREISQNYMVCFKHFEAIYLKSGVRLFALEQEAVPTVDLTGDVSWFYESDYYKTRLKVCYENSYKDLRTSSLGERKKDDTGDTTDLRTSSLGERKKDDTGDITDLHKIDEDIWIKDDVIEDTDLQANNVGGRSKDDTENTTDLLKIEEHEWIKDEVIKDTDDVFDKTKCVLEEDRIRFPGIGHTLYMPPTIDASSGKRKTSYKMYKHFKNGYGWNNNAEIGETIKIHTAIIIDDDDECEKEVLKLLLDKRKRV